MALIDLASQYRRKRQVLFVCTENICRSPLAEGVLRHHLELAGRGGEIRVISAGTRAAQPGVRPDQRAQRVAASAGIQLGRIRAQRVTPKVLVASELVLAMDAANLESLREICPPEHQHKLTRLLDHHPGADSRDVPDPYFGNIQQFEHVFQLIQQAVVDLISPGGALGVAPGETA